MPNTHFLECFKNVLLRKSDTPALVTSDNKTIAWSKYYEDTSSFANGLELYNVEQEETIAIMGFNNYYWHVSAIGSAIYGSPFTGIYPTNGPEEVDHNLSLTNASVLVIENMKLLEKINLKRKLKLIIVYDDETNIDLYQDIPVVNMTKFLNVHKQFNYPKNEVSGEKTLCYIFTSGTTGLSKAVTISHDNVTYTAERMCDIYQLNNERVVSYLPLSHIAASMIDIFCHIYHQGTIFFAKPDALRGSLKDTLVIARPTMFFGVPRVWEKMREAMLKKAAEKYKGTIGGILKSIVQCAKNNTKSIHVKSQKNMAATFKEKFVYNTLGKLFFKKIKTELGLNQCKFFMTGAAPISVEILEYFASIDIVINELYGMSETTGVITASLPNHYRWGSAGKSLIGQVKIADDGEILYQSKCVFKEYKDNQEATNETLVDGWLHTGDIGEVREGYLYITGRKKELLITGGGENVAPVKIEERIKENGPALSQVIVIGDRKKYLTCLVTLATKENSNELLNKEVDPTSKTLPTAQISELWKNYIQKAVDTYNANPVSNAQKIQKFVILNEDLSIENGCMTPTMKIKRAKVYEKFAEDIDKMYQE